MLGQKPVVKFAVGQISAAVWENRVTTQAGKKVTMLKATVERRYKDRDGQWKSSNSFGRNKNPFCHLLPAEKPGPHRWSPAGG